MDQQTTGTSTMPPQQLSRPHFLALPVEIRLEVYGHCSAFTLLQLSNTCRQTRTDLDEHRSVYQKSFGYDNQISIKTGRVLQLNDVMRLDTSVEYHLFMRMYTNGRILCCGFCHNIFTGGNRTSFWRQNLCRLCKLSMDNPSWKRRGTVGR
ncbi:hypothetical protein BJ508DRAFT_410641 [Ascobolus immersus RN42]|uniref:F-box domain-containing protein n=1 Tax=Ascobolus immersus RN42 TaxID=1160509 RepID=A0A3N4ILR1_ASCIM|nr:hypothetical protein BJ508DRAFT_410641 [Ascobolus immersus RN42]